MDFDKLDREKLIKLSRSSDGVLSGKPTEIAIRALQPSAARAVETLQDMMLWTKEKSAFLEAEMLASMPPNDASTAEFLEYQLKALAATFDITTEGYLRSAVLTDETARLFESLLDETEKAVLARSPLIRPSFVPHRLFSTEARTRLRQRKQYWIGHMLKLVRERKEATPADSAAATPTPPSSIAPAETRNPNATKGEATAPEEQISAPAPRKRGPKRDYETALQVAAVITQLAPDGNWRERVEEICDGLDEAEVGRAKPWKKRGYRTWSDCFLGERGLVNKAIEHHIDLAHEHKETFS